MLKEIYMKYDPKEFTYGVELERSEEHTSELQSH